MKKPSTPILLGCLGIAISSLLSSCVATYDTGMREPTTRYQAGYELRTLPSGYRTETISGTRYYTYDNTYYRQRDGRYIVVESPHRRYDRDSRYDSRYDGRRRQSETTVITRLPSGYRTRTYNGTRYYQVDDRYYQQQGSGYIIVQRPY